MNVFVLGTGRCGSVTLSRACAHITNFSSGHETRWGRIGDDRFAFPDRHIEIDNRLSWFLGDLGARFSDAFYVHLLRDREAVARSFDKRWHFDPPKVIERVPERLYPYLQRFETSGTNRGIIGGYAYNILGRIRPWEESERLDVCRSYVDTVTANITEFLRHRDHLTVRVESFADDVTAMWERIGAEGDLDEALAELTTVNNAS